MISDFIQKVVNTARRFLEWSHPRLTDTTQKLVDELTTREGAMTVVAIAISILDLGAKYSWALTSRMELVLMIGLIVARALLEGPITLRDTHNTGGAR